LVNNNILTAFIDDFSTLSGWPRLFPINIDAITELGVYKDKITNQIRSEDILVLSGDEYYIYERQKDSYVKYLIELEAKSEAETNRISIFDPKTRTQNYWKDVISEPLKNVIDINAFVYFPDGVLYVFGRTEFCKISINETSDFVVSLIHNYKLWTINLFLLFKSVTKRTLKSCLDVILRLHFQLIKPILK
jgi:hypothetical protein